MRARRVVSTVVGSALLPTFVLLSTAACRVEAERFNAAPQRIGEYEVSLQLDPNPPKSGRETQIVVTIVRGGEPVEATEVEPHLNVDMPEMPMGHPEVTLQYEGSGRWRGVITFPMPGDWAATVRLMPEGSEARFQLEVGP